ncbi:MAG TPA: serine hydrolase domain-containing protein [Blastococcus sp.]|jgi:CubicO group peptidase (beta-lactamase class C family)|nr:serine hydrolase domain-containing protein [Blastococcus sp.]
MTRVQMQVQGAVEPGFEPVADAFRDNFRERGDTGAACSVYAGGRPVVDIWAGRSERGPWQRNTRSTVFSTSKGVLTVCLLMAVERGLLDLDAPVATYWPEFAAAGKALVTVRQLLAHRAGLVAPADDLTVADLADWHPVTRALAQQAPLWEPGTQFAYHALTLGWLAGEVLRRATGRRPAQWLHEDIAGPLGLTMTYGAEPQAADLAPIGAPLPSADPAAAEALAALQMSPLAVRAMTMGGAVDGLDLFRAANTPAFLSYESPAANLVTTAGSLAKLYAATVGHVDGIRLLGADIVRDARTVQSAGPSYLGFDDGNRWGTGFMIDSPHRAMLGPGSYGHDGAGGQLAFAHLEREVAFAYVTVRPGGVPDDRAEALCRALHSCL